INPSAGAVPEDERRLRLRDPMEMRPSVTVPSLDGQHGHSIILQSHLASCPSLDGLQLSVQRSGLALTFRELRLGSPQRLRAHCGSEAQALLTRDRVGELAPDELLLSLVACSLAPPRGFGVRRRGGELEDPERRGRLLALDPPALHAFAKLLVPAGRAERLDD